MLAIRENERWTRSSIIISTKRYSTRRINSNNPVFIRDVNVCLSENQENRWWLKLAGLSLAETVRETEIFRL